MFRKVGSPSTARRAPWPFSLAAAGLLTLLLLPAGRPVKAGPQGPLPEISISGVATETEGKHGPTRPFYFPVKLSQPSSQPVTVSFATVSLVEQATDFNFASATADKDYVTTGGTLIFAPGETSKTVRVVIVNDDLREPNEAFFVALFSPINATLSADAGVAIGKITNQDLPYQTPECAEEFPLRISPIPPPGQAPVKPSGGMVLGPDGQFWMTALDAEFLIRFNPTTRTSTLVPVPAGTDPHFLTVGPDGNIWFSSLHDQIGRVDITTHAVTLFTQGITPGSVPHVILPGPDGRMYFTEQASEPETDPFGRRSTRVRGTGRLARLDIGTGVITEFPNGLPEGNRMHGLAFDAQGNAWVALEGVDQIARFNLATQTYDRFVSFSAGSNPTNILLGPDNNLYVALQDIGRLGQFNPTTGAKVEIPTNLTPQDGFSLVYFTVGPDNNIWFTELQNDRIGVYDIAQQRITEIECGITPGAGPIGIVVGPDNALWFNEVVLDLTQTGRVGRIVSRPPHRFVEASTGYTTSVFRDLMEREVNDAALTFFGPLLAAGVANRFQVAQAIQNSLQADIQAVIAEYNRLLDRNPTSAELNSLVSALQRGADVRDVDTFIMGSTEYFDRRANGTIDGFLQAIYNDVLGRNPDSRIGAVFNSQMLQPGRRLPARAPLGVPGDPTQLGMQFTPDQYPKLFAQVVQRQAFFKNQRTVVPFKEIARATGAGTARSTIAGVLIFSEEGTQKLVRSFYGRYSLGPADARLLPQYMTSLMRGLTTDAVLADIAASKRYLDTRVLSVGN